jgi:hypothetical protein
MFGRKEPHLNLLDEDAENEASTVVELALKTSRQYQLSVAIAMNAKLAVWRRWRVGCSIARKQRLAERSLSSLPGLGAGLSSARWLQLLLHAWRLQAVRQRRRSAARLIDECRILKMRVMQCSHARQRRSSKALPLTDVCV